MIGSPCPIKGNVNRVHTKEGMCAKKLFSHRASAPYEAATCERTLAGVKIIQRVLDIETKILDVLKIIGMRQYLSKKHML